MFKFSKFAAAGAAALALALTATPQAVAQPKGFQIHAPASQTVVDHSAWGTFLETYGVASPDGLNRVKYGQVTEADKLALAGYIKSLEAIDPTMLSADEAFAYWANLYNALTVDLIVKNYPVKSIKEISSGLFNNGPWKMKATNVNGQDLTLDDIEHGILRTVWKEPRVHYAVNCASIGCPNLALVPLTGETLEAQLTKGAKAYVNSPRGVSVVNGKVTASNIYKWFAEDFGGNEAGVIAHLTQYADKDLSDALAQRGKIDKYDYDWSLNEVK